MQQKAFLEKWIQMTNERVAGFEDLSQQYQTLVHDYERRYQEKLTSISNELIESYDLSSVDDYSRYNPQLRILFDLIIELKQSLQPLQDQLKTDKRFLFTPVFRLSNDISNQINTFLSIYHVLSLLPNSIVLVFSDGNEYQSSYSCILSYDKLQKIIKVFNNNSTIYNSWIILFHMKVFLESLYTKSMQWSQDSKKLMPIGTRAGIKKAAIQYKFSDLIKVLEDPVTRYIEPPGYHELVEVSNSFQECEKDLISLLIPEGRDDDEDYEDTQIVSYLDLCRLVERWNNLRDRIHQLPIQFDKYSALFKWLTELFEWIRAVPEQVFDLLQIPDLNTNHFNVTNNSRKLNLIDKDKCNVLIDIGNNFLTQSNNQILTQLFNELHALDNDNLNNTSTNSSPFYHFSEKVNSIIRFTPKIHQYFTKCFDETIQYESLAKGILDKISNFTTPENLDKSIDTLKKLIGRCDELLILPDGLLRINMKNLLRQLETSLWDGITLFNENNKKVEQESSIEVFTDSEQWIPSNLNNTQGTSEELLTSAISYFEDEDEEFIDESLLGDDDDDEFLPSPAKKRKRTKNKKYDVETSHHKSSGRKSSTSDFIDLEEEDESLQNCIIDGCEWPRMKNSSYCSESCAMKGYSHLFDALLNFKPLANHQIISQNHDDNNSKFEQVVQALDQGNTTPEALLHECKVFGMRTADIMLHSLSQVSIDFLFPQLPPIGAALSNTLRKQVRTELQHAILSALTRLKIPCAFGCAVVMATDIEKAMSLNVTSEDSVRAYRKKYLLLSKALKDPYNDAKIHKILFHEMSVEDFLKLDSTEFDDDEKQQRRLESINAEKKKLVPAGKSLTELIEEKRRAAEEGAEAWRDGTIMDQAAGVKSASSTLPSKSSAPISSTITPVPKKPPKEIHVEVKAKEPEIKVESKKHESPRSHPSPKPSPKQVAPPISSLLQMDSNKRPKVEKNEDMSHISVPASEQKVTTPIATSTPIEYFTDVRVSTPLGPASAHVPQMPNPEDGPLKVLLTNSNDSEFVIHITNYPIMRETISLVCTGGIFDCTGQGILVSGIQNDKRYQVDALRKQLRNFRKHIPISILVLSVKEERELTEVKYRHICKMFSDPEKERIPSVEFHGEHEQTYNLHIVVPQLAHYFPQLNSIIQRSTSVLPHGFWLYGILEMDRDAQGPESLVRCNQVDFPLENIKFLMGKVDKLVHTIESMPEPDVKLAIERVQQTVGDQLDFLNPGHKDFQFFINQVNQRLREKKLQEWSRDNEKKRKLDGKTERVREVTEKPKDDRQSIGSSRSSSFETRNPSPRGHESNHSHMSISRRASHEEQLPYKEPQLARSYSDEYSSQYRNGSNSIKEERNHDWKNPTSQRKSRFS